MTLTLRMTSLPLFLLALLWRDVTSDCRKVTTFNAGLATITPTSPRQRFSRTLEALKALDSDVLCLQEIYRVSDMRTLIRQLRRKYRYSTSFVHRAPRYARMAPRYPPACSQDDVDYYTNTVIPCITANGCPSAFSPVELLHCMVTNCAAELADPGFSAECFSCNLAEGDVTGESLAPPRACRQNRFGRGQYGIKRSPGARQTS